MALVTHVAPHRREHPLIISLLYFIFRREYTICKSLMAIETGILPLNGKVLKCYSYFIPSHILYHVSFLSLILILEPFVIN